MTAENSDIASVLRYYEVVDADDVPALIDLFAPDAVYYRPGYPPMRGHADLRRFYVDERVIAEGHHSIASAVADGNRVATHGEFAGTLKDGQKVELRFADFFELGPDGRFARRDTFFFSPAV
ncbi:nuclear transport factor 2 family protein [Micromonospora sp. NPDC048843]|uniref:nuclear transport factor 2 family protein n=1 Tax=Micromonospora sp. NPDC048843 TaxID=3155389 RepID=UPI0033D3A6F9